ncbi:MAG TPA: RAMP superfamily CRISPR-associated protein [Roseiflexaceae bacterium]|nr:RAMP superfamily CRISPR-associated protein [Roseiflexaceae bacterium]
MHKATFLEGTLVLTIEPDGPLLVKAGEGSGADPTLPSMEFVRTHQSRGREVYIPGPSLKGVVRAQAERICRSLDRAGRDPEADRPPLADNPLGRKATYGGLDDTDYSDGQYLDSLRNRDDYRDKPERTAVIYRRSSFASRLFGNTSLAGRVRFADAYPAGPVRLEERNGVAIDRIYGSVAVGPFNYETVVDARFTTQIAVKNVTLAQLALLGLALRDLAEGRVAVGFGKSRGLGRVKVTFERLELRYPTCELVDGQVRLLSSTVGVPDTDLAGLAALCPREAYAEYHLPQRDHVPLPNGLAYRIDEDDLLGVRLTADGDTQVRAVWKACMPCWREAIGL